MCLVTENIEKATRENCKNGDGGRDPLLPLEILLGCVIFKKINMRKWFYPCECRHVETVKYVTNKNYIVLTLINVKNLTS
jgi:hypothetical protein